MVNLRAVMTILWDLLAYTGRVSTLKPAIVEKVNLIKISLTDKHDSTTSRSEIFTF